MTGCGGGTWTVRNTRPGLVSAMRLLPERSRCSSTSLSGSAATSAAFTSRCAPFSTSVTTIAARRAARSAFSAERISRRIVFPESSSPGSRAPRGDLLDLLDQHADGAAAGEPDVPRGLVADAELRHLRLAALAHVERLGDDRALDAAARHRAEKIPLLVDDEIGADRPRRRAPGLHDGRQRDPTPAAAPFLGGLQDFLVAREHRFSSVGTRVLLMRNVPQY